MEIFDVFSMNGIENNPASGEFFLENVIFKVPQTHFSRIYIPRGGPMPPLGLAKGGHKFSKGGQCPPLGGGGGREVPCTGFRLIKESQADPGVHAAHVQGSALSKNPRLTLQCMQLMYTVQGSALSKNPRLTLQCMQLMYTVQGSALSKNPRLTLQCMQLMYTVQGSALSKNPRLTLQCVQLMYRVPPYQRIPG